MNTNSESEDDTIHKLIGEATVCNGLINSSRSGTFTMLMVCGKGYNHGHMHIVDNDHWISY